ncbi:protein of unknown function [Enterobacter cancerogenus]|nr:protein of unknown function [Enterobacter cancerogenus]
MISHWNKLAQLLEGLWLKLTNGLTNFFITHTITKTNVHTHSRSKYAQSVSENGYDYNSTSRRIRVGRVQKMRKFVTALNRRKQKRTPKRPF